MSSTGTSRGWTPTCESAPAAELPRRAVAVLRFSGASVRPSAAAAARSAATSASSAPAFTSVEQCGSAAAPHMFWSAPAAFAHARAAAAAASSSSPSRAVAAVATAGARSVRSAVSRGRAPDLSSRPAQSAVDRFTARPASFSRAPTKVRGVMSVSSGSAASDTELRSASDSARFASAPTAASSASGSVSASEAAAASNWMPPSPAIRMWCAGNSESFHSAAVAFSIGCGRPDSSADTRSGRKAWAGSFDVVKVASAWRRRLRSTPTAASASASERVAETAWSRGARASFARRAAYASCIAMLPSRVAQPTCREAVCVLLRRAKVRVAPATASRS